MFTIPATMMKIGHLLSTAHAKERADNQHCLLKILSCLRFLAWQGCGIRGSGDEVDGNFSQLIKLQAQEDPKVLIICVVLKLLYSCPCIRLCS